MYPNMNVNNIIREFNFRNELEVHRLNDATNKLIEKIKISLAKEYKSANWSKFLGCTQLGVTLTNIDPSFSNFNKRLSNAYIR